MNKLSRDRTETIKDLMANEEMLTALNEDTAHKLMEEKEKYNTLRNDHIDISERIAIKRKAIVEDSAYNKETETTINNLKKEIEKLDKDVNTKQKQLDEETVLNGVEAKKNRSLAQKKSALTAKRQFIEDNYDYSSNVKDLSIELFKQIQSSNT